MSDQEKPTMRQLAVAYAVEKLAAPVAVVMAKGGEDADRVFEGFVRAVRIMMGEWPQVMAQYEADRVAKRMVEGAGDGK